MVVSSVGEAAAMKKLGKKAQVANPVFRQKSLSTAIANRLLGAIPWKYRCLPRFKGVRRR